MKDKRLIDKSRYEDDFIKEARRYLKVIARGLNRLKEDPTGDISLLLDKVHISIHNIKGTSATLGFKGIEEASSDMDKIVTKLIEGRCKATPQLIDLLCKKFDNLKTVLGKIG